MKSVLSGKCCKKEEKPFPKLMGCCSSGKIMLMQSRRKGVVVHSTSSSLYSIGEFLDDVTESNYSDYEGDVCLTND